jgi:hypothetical protein
LADSAQLISTWNVTSWSTPLIIARAGSGAVDTIYAASLTCWTVEWRDTRLTGFRGLTDFTVLETAVEVSGVPKMAIFALTNILNRLSKVDAAFQLTYVILNRASVTSDI